MIRAVGTGGNIRTYAGGGTGCPAQTSPLGDGCSAAQATLSIPTYVATDSNYMDILDSGDNVVRKVQYGGGIITTVAGAAGASCTTFTEGSLATATPLCTPKTIAVDAAGDIYIGGGNRVQMVDAGTGQIWTVAGGDISGVQR